MNQECLNLSGVPHFEIGGTIHLVTNNQLGFTTPSDRGRSSRYCTDLAKMISAPVIHVNADYPEVMIRTYFPLVTFSNDSIKYGSSKLS